VRVRDKSLFGRSEFGRYVKPPVVWARHCVPCGGGRPGVESTVDDLLAFLQLLLNGGEYRGRRLLSSDLVAQMTSDQLTPQQKVDAGLTPGYTRLGIWRSCHDE
jgi:CubicO group peptidase (beta-lactamase class C family)